MHQHLRSSQSEAPWRILQEEPTNGNSSSGSSGSKVMNDSAAKADNNFLDGAGVASRTPYFELSFFSIVWKRFPWLLSLMLVQSISGWVVERFSALVQKHVVLASFLTMLVGGGGNSSGQTVAELVRLLSTGEIRSRQLCRVLLRELGIGAVLGLGLGAFAYPRVLLLSANATHDDALTISLAYTVIVTMANAIGVIVAMTLHLCDAAAVGSPPVVQVVVDVLGVTITMLIAQAILSEAPDPIGQVNGGLAET
jgi:magnesium transporter